MMPSIICFGEILVDFTARGTPDSPGDAFVFEKYSGGAPANTASALGRLGANVAMLGSVGADYFGEFLKKELDRCGVDTRCVQFLKDRPTAVVFVSLDSQKVPHFHSFGEGVAYNYFRADKKALGLISGSKIFHFSSVSLIQDPYRREAMKALESAREAGVWVSFDPNIRLHLFKSEKSARDLIGKALPYAQILKLGEEEFRFLFGDADPERACAKLARNGAELILITEGEKGSTFYFKGTLQRVDAFPVKTVDSTGAGDAFIGGILSRLAAYEKMSDISPEEMREIVRFGSAVAAISTTKRGATTALPDLKQVLRYLHVHSQRSSLTN
jgi:fructokinase